MNAKDFFHLVSSMRKAQRDYFRTRTTEALNKSKSLDYFYGCAVCKVDGVLLHKCNDKVKGDVRKALECVNNNIKKQ